MRSSQSERGVPSQRRISEGVACCVVSGKITTKEEAWAEMAKMQRNPPQEDAEHSVEGTAGAKAPVLGSGLESSNLLSQCDCSTVNK